MIYDAGMMVDIFCYITVNEIAQNHHWRKTMLIRFQRYPAAHMEVFPQLNLEKEIDDLVGSILNTPRFAPRGSACPRVDVADHESESIVVAELPGVRKEDLKVSIHDGVLTIGGRRETLDLPDKAKWLQNETATGEFQRTIRLPHEVKGAKVTAELTNGILRVVLPKVDEARPREIAVR